MTSITVNNFDIFLFILFILSLFFMFHRAEAIMEANGIGGTGTDTLAAPDTLCMIRGSGDIHIHLTDSGTFSTGDAFMPIDLYFEQRNLIRQRIEGPEGTDPFAERTIEQYG